MSVGDAILISEGGLDMSNIVPVERIEQKILMIRGEKVMLDSDLAMLYGVETRALNQAVKRNKDRFPKDFMFHLTRGEIKRISQFVTSSGGHKTLKYSKRVTVFTEYGVAMLSSVLNSPRAIHVIFRLCGHLENCAKLPLQTGTYHAAWMPLRKNMMRGLRLCLRPYGSL